jgi:penicillin-binding protein 2
MTKKRDKFTFSTITPDEIFLDSQNIPDFDRNQFEGRVEKSLNPRVFYILGILFLLGGFVLTAKTAYLQITKGAYFAEHAENNHLRSAPISPERGLIYDRNGKLLVWNDPAFSLVLGKEILKDGYLLDDLNILLSSLNLDSDEILKKMKESDGDVVLDTFYDWHKINEIYREWDNLPLKIESVSLRSYLDMPGLSHVVGYLGYPSSDELENTSFAIYEEMIGKDGVEKKYQEILMGQVGYKLVETDSTGSPHSEWNQKSSVPGENIVLTIDSDIQSKLYEIIEGLVNERGFNGGAGIILNVHSGDILSLVSYPEYSSGVLTRGGPPETIHKYLNDPQKPFLNRAISGLYAPGSVVKPFVALGALNEETISPRKQIFSSGSISIPNPYFPDEESVFFDWKAHGWVDMKRAIAVSSNVYFYSLGGGYEDVVGLGIKKLNDYFKAFGLGQKTGIDLEKETNGLVPGPEIKASLANDPIWRIGDTYNVSIGQGNFQVTPLQMATAVASLANSGYKIKPHVFLQEEAEASELEPITVDGELIEEEYFDIIKEGMRRAVLEGTAQGLSGLPIKIAAKTGTAELGSGKLVNSWLVAFWPYDDPQYVMTIVLEKGDAKNLVGSVFAAKQFMEWLIFHSQKHLTNPL